MAVKNHLGRRRHTRPNGVGRASETFRPMPTTVQMTRCIARARGALVFWSPDAARCRPRDAVQIPDVFSLQVASGYTRDPQGRSQLEPLLECSAPTSQVP
jgi:hypothetical protein